MATLTAKEKLFKSLTDNGWALDPRHKVAKSPYDVELIPGRNVFLHPAAHGGQWRIELEWTSTGSPWNRSEGNRLRGVHVFHVPTDIEYETTKRGYDCTYYVEIGELSNTDNNDWRTSHLWDALKWNGPGDTVGTLRQAVDHLIKDPDYAIWLGLVEQARANEERAENNRKADELARAQARALPVTVDQKGWNNEWKRLAEKLEQTTVRIKNADGTSDLPLLLSNARVALDNLVEVLTDEASLEYAEHLGLL